MDYIKLIGELNQELFDKVGETDRDFNYSTNGYIDVISFGELTIWCSEDSERIWDEDEKVYEPFKPFIKRMYRNEIDKLSKFVF